MIEIKRLRRFYHTAHKQLWDWLAAHPDKYKDEWPGWEEWDEHPGSALFGCFACAPAQVASKVHGDDYSRCEACPLDWAPYEFCCQEIDSGYSENGVFCQWDGLLEEYFYADLNASDDVLAILAKRAELARQICDMPLRPDRPEDPFITEVI